MAEKQSRRRHTGHTKSGSVRDVRIQRIGRMTIYRRGKAYYLYYRERGRSVRRKVKGTLAAVRVIASRVSTSVEEGSPSPLGFTRIGVDDLADGFIDYCESVQQLALRTVERYRAALAVSYSALFVSNLYRPLVPSRTEAHYVAVGRWLIAFVMIGGIGTAVLTDNVLVFVQYLITVGGTFGAAVWLGFLWRGVTKTAVFVQVVCSFLIMAFIPISLQILPAARTHEPFLVQTPRKTVTIQTGALQSEVDAGLAEYVGQVVTKAHVIEPAAIFYENVARQDPSDPNSPFRGYGRFNCELWILSLFGLDLTRFSRAGLATSRYLFDAFHPFLLLFIISAFARRPDKKLLDRFFVKMHTPVRGDPEEDRRVLEENYAHPDLFQDRKVFPKTVWEILKPGKLDFIGFFGTWAAVGVVILTLYLVFTLV